VHTILQLGYLNNTAVGVYMLVS